MTELDDLQLQLDQAEEEVVALRQAVAISLTEINTKWWGRGTATNMIRQRLRDWPVIQEIPPDARTALRDKILPPLAKES